MVYEPTVESDGQRKWKDSTGVDTTHRQLCVLNTGEKKLKLASGYADPTVRSDGTFVYKVVTETFSCTNWWLANDVILYLFYDFSQINVHFIYSSTSGTLRTYVLVQCNYIIGSCSNEVILTERVDPSSSLTIDTSSKLVNFTVYFQHLYFNSGLNRSKWWLIDAPLLPQVVDEVDFCGKTISCGVTMDQLNAKYINQSCSEPTEEFPLFFGAFYVA